MLLLFNPDPPLLRWCKVIGERTLFNETEFDAGCLQHILESIDDPSKIKAVGTLLVNGGDAVREAAQRVTPDDLDRVRDCIKLLPEQNGMTLKTSFFWIERFPDVPHVLVCDTAFFASLPAEASTYAVPMALRKQGIKRYGGDGLCHQQAWEAAIAFYGKELRSVVSIRLGNATTLAAISDGRPAETTVGFTSIEGIPSATGCGDIDPTIVLQLHASGVSYEEINILLTRESGFGGLLGRECGYSDLTREKAGPDIAAVRDFYVYQVVKSIGAFLSVLGGADALLFSCEDPDSSAEMIERIVRHLDFLGVRLKPGAEGKGSLTDLTGSGSAMRVASLRFDLWRTLVQKTLALS